MTMKMTAAVLVGAGIAAATLVAAPPKKSSSSRSTKKAPKAEVQKVRSSSAKKAKKAEKAAEKSETRITREQAEAKKLVAALTTTQKTKLLALLNEGDAKALTSISGVGKTRATQIANARPFDKVEDLAGVRGVGPRTFTEVVAHGKSLTSRSRKSTKASS